MTVMSICVCFCLGICVFECTCSECVGWGEGVDREEAQPAELLLTREPLIDPHLMSS